MSNYTIPYINEATDKEIYAAYDRVFNSPDGRIVLNHLLGEACLLGRDVSSIEDKDIRYNIGRQKVGHVILKILNTSN